MISIEEIHNTPAADTWRLPTPSVSRRILGIDVGGANLKFSYQLKTASCPFPMWLQSRFLADRIRAVMADLTPATPPDSIAVTMTGELADCFSTRRAGVEHILDQLGEVFPDERISVYGVDGRWHTPEVAKSQPWEVAASNWHALASWLGQANSLDGTQFDLIVDIGSTTVDVIPMRNGRVATSARTDRQRLQLGQLVYTGYERTPVAAITRHVMIQGEACPLMAERFADSLDAYLALGYALDDVYNTETADGRERTRRCGQARLARMVGEDLETLPTAEIESIARQLIEHQTYDIVAAIRRNLPRDSARGPSIAFCGHGLHLLDRVKACIGECCQSSLRLEECLGPSASRNAPAIAVAMLLEQTLATGQ